MDKIAVVLFIGCKFSAMVVWHLLMLNTYLMRIVLTNVLRVDKALLKIIQPFS